jgi:hypothetical protein
MEPPTEQNSFKSWQKALAENKLTPEQLKVLQDMVSSGTVDSIQTAAAMLDWQDNVIQPDEHMYGF